MQFPIERFSGVPQSLHRSTYRLLNEEEVEMGFINQRREAPRAINHISTDTESNNRLTQRGRLL